MKMVVVKGVFAGQERRGWFPALTGSFNVSGKSDAEASSSEDPAQLEDLVTLTLSLVESATQVRVVEVDSNFKVIQTLH